MKVWSMKGQKASLVEQAFMERRWAWLTKSVLWSMGDHWKQRMCCAAAVIWGCVGWYGWARLFRSICMNISCQEAKLQSEISVLYEKHMLQLSPLPGRFFVGAEIPGVGCGLPLSAPKGGPPLVLIWTVGTSLLQALLPGLFLQQEDGTAGERMNKILFQMQCVYTVVFWGFFCSWHCCACGCHWDLLREWAELKVPVAATLLQPRLWWKYWY